MNYNIDHINNTVTSYHPSTMLLTFRIKPSSQYVRNIVLHTPLSDVYMEYDDGWFVVDIDAGMFSPGTSTYSYSEEISESGEPYLQTHTSPEYTINLSPSNISKNISTNISRAYNIITSLIMHII